MKVDVESGEGFQRRRREGEGGGRKGEHDTVRPWRTDVETIEARYTSESLFALMAYVWKREGRREREGGGEVDVLSGHPYAYYAFAPRSVAPYSTPAPIFVRPSYGGNPPAGWVTRRAN